MCASPSFPDRITVVGHPYSNLGTGENARLVFKALRAAGVDANICDVYGADPNVDPRYVRDYAAHAAAGLSSSCNIFCLNANEVDQALEHLNDNNFLRAYNIIHPAWELSDLPDAWVEPLRLFDEVWTMSSFYADSIAAKTGRPVYSMSDAVDVRLDSFLGKRHFGFPDHAFVFLFFFDFSSYIQRKNPFAFIRAFRRLKSLCPEAPLHAVLKYKGHDANDARYRDLVDLLQGHSHNVTRIEHPLTENETKNLIRCADCFVSLHRCEGFGRGLAEAMAVGTPVIATRYSGNLDFMTEDNSYLVDCKLIPIAQGEYPYPEKQVWADPDVHHAAALMRRVYERPDEVREKVRRARRDITVNHGVLGIGLNYWQRLAAIASIPPGMGERAA